MRTLHKLIFAFCLTGMVTYGLAGIAHAATEDIQTAEELPEGAVLDPEMSLIHHCPYGAQSCHCHRWENHGNGWYCTRWHCHTGPGCGGTDLM